VPTVAQRGLFQFGALPASRLLRLPILMGLSSRFSKLLLSHNINRGSAVQLFPFPITPNGVFGANTLTQVLPASGRSRIFSGKVDRQFQIER